MLSLDNSWTIQQLDQRFYEQYARNSSASFGTTYADEMNMLTNHLDNQFILGLLHEDLVLSQVFIHSLKINIHEQIIPIAGFAGVTTHSDHRGHGYATQLLKYTLRWLYAQSDYPLALLYPTTYQLYHRLGWSLVGQQTTYSAPPADFKPIEAPTNMVRTKPRRVNVNDLADLEAIRNNCVEMIHGAVLRDRFGWKIRIMGLHSTQVGPWVVYTIGEDDKPDGYVLYHLHNDDLNVVELIASNRKGWQCLLDFLADQNHITKITLSINNRLAFLENLSNPLVFDVQAGQTAYGMLRIVDLQKVLALRQVSINDNQIVPLSVQDNVIDSNNMLLFSHGHQNLNTKPISIGSMTQLWSGVCDVNTLKLLEVLNIEPPVKQQQLQQLFPYRSFLQLGDVF